MSFTYSRALVEEFLLGTCSDADASVPSNSTPTPDQSWWPDKTTEHSRLSRFGMTCGPLTGVRGEELLTWWLAASRARTSALPERETALTENAPASGASLRGSFAKYDPAGLKWKTPQCSLVEGLDEFSETWPRWGLMRNGECWERTTVVPPTSGNESGLWQTPVADDAMSRPKGKWNSRGEPKLSAQVLHPEHWPTSRSCSAMAATITPESVWNPKRFPNLETVVGRRMWPRPVATMSKGSSPASLTRKSGRDRSNDRLDHAVMAADGVQLNPTWVEWLMNWPLGWTSLEPLAKEIFDDWRRKTQRAQTGASSNRAGSVRVMREASHGQASPRPQQTSGGDSFVPKLSPGGRCGTPSHRGSQGGREKVGESLKGGDVLLLWSDVHEGESASDNLLPVMWQQTGMGESAWWGSEPDGVPRVSKGVAHRADRLKAIGNGQVSAVAATAWQILGGS